MSDVQCGKGSKLLKSIPPLGFLFQLLTSQHTHKIEVMEHVKQEFLYIFLFLFSHLVTPPLPCSYEFKALSNCRPKGSYSPNSMPMCKTYSSIK